MSNDYEKNGIIFDFYGVIRHDIQQTWLHNQGLQRIGEFAVASNLLDAGEISMEEYLRRYSLASGVPPTDIQRAFDDTPMVEGMESFLRELHGTGLRMGLLSNADSGPRHYLEETELLQLFDDIVISAEVGYRKPDPEIYRLALNRLDLVPGTTIFVDDNRANIDAAAAIGIDPILFSTAGALRRELLTRRILRK